MGDEYETFFRADAAGRYNHAREIERSPSRLPHRTRSRSRQREYMRRSRHFAYSESNSDSESDAETSTAPAPRVIDTEGGAKGGG